MSDAGSGGDAAYGSLPDTSALTGEAAAALAEDGVDPAAAAPADAAPAPTGSGLIKGERDAMLYYTPDSADYLSVVATELFETEDEAEGAGYTRA